MVRPVLRGQRVSRAAWDAMAARNRKDLALYEFAFGLFVRAVMTSEAAHWQRPSSDETESAAARG